MDAHASELIALAPHEAIGVPETAVEGAAELEEAEAALMDAQASGVVAGSGGGRTDESSTSGAQGAGAGGCAAGASSCAGGSGSGGSGGAGTSSGSGGSGGAGTSSGAMGGSGAEGGAAGAPAATAAAGGDSAPHRDRIKSRRSHDLPIKSSAEIAAENAAVAAEAKRQRVAEQVSE